MKPDCDLRRPDDRPSRGFFASRRAPVINLRRGQLNEAKVKLVFG